MKVDANTKISFLNKRIFPNRNRPKLRGLLRVIDDKGNANVGGWYLVLDSEQNYSGNLGSGSF